MTQSKPMPWFTVVAVLAGILCVLGLVAALLIFATPKRAAAEVPTREELRAADEQRLNSYGWVEQPGVVHVPAERAAELLLKERGAK